MNRNIISAVLVLLVVLLGIFYFSKNANKTKLEVGFSNQISGQIIEVKDSLIVVEGIAKSSDPANAKYEKRVIEFTLAPETVFTKTVLTMPENAESNKFFFPGTKEMPGKISDLIVGVRIMNIESKENLFAVDKAVANKVNYAIYDFLEPQN